MDREVHWFKSPCTMWVFSKEYHVANSRAKEVDVWANTQVWLHLCIHAHVCTYVHIYVCVCMYVCLYIQNTTKLLTASGDGSCWPYLFLSKLTTSDWPATVASIIGVIPSWNICKLTIHVTRTVCIASYICTYLQSCAWSLYDYVYMNDELTYKTECVATYSHIFVWFFVVYHVFMIYT